MSGVAYALAGDVRIALEPTSRGEGGILGEGIRQALLRDPLYQPALLTAQALAG